MHNVPPLNMTKAVASVIGGLIDKVLKVDKDDGYSCASRFALMSMNTYAWS